MTWAQANPESGPVTILLGVGAGIAAYKIAYVVRGLRERGHEVHVLPTRNSLEFVGEQTWQELSENPVSTEVLHGAGEISHVRLARQAKLFVVAPATADLLAKLRLGLADDMLTATFLATSCPKLLVPAMHTHMWQNPATQENVRCLRERGVLVLEPAAGALSSGDTGRGRMPEPDQILAQIDDLLSGARPGPLTGKKVIVTAGGTVEAIDPVRYLGNHSTGRQGVEIAKAAARAGAEVILLAGNTSVELPRTPHIQVVECESAALMLNALNQHGPSADILFMAAAVADYRPRTSHSEKLKKEKWGAQPVIELVQNPDLLHTIAHGSNRPKVIVGFAAETGSADEVIAAGKAKAKQKGADLIAINQVGDGLGFGEVDNTLFVVDSLGEPVAELAGSKADLAKGLVELAAAAAR